MKIILKYNLQQEIKESNLVIKEVADKKEKSKEQTREKSPRNSGKDWSENGPGHASEQNEMDRKIQTRRNIRLIRKKLTGQKRMEILKHAKGTSMEYNEMMMITCI